MVEFVFLFGLLFSPLVLVLDLLVPHLLLKLNFPFLLCLFVVFSLIVILDLLLLKIGVGLFLPLFLLLLFLLLLQLPIQLDLHLFLELLFADTLKFLFFFEEFGVELDESCPLIFLVAFNVVDRLSAN